ncbi:hypothetical protein [Nitrosomonas sp.]|uniref:hypothetical protein n=1 Tax=Nitrosomonas sp. TaxID=42353 RepID=UPI00342BA0AB
MSSVRGSNTKPELLLRKALWHKGLRYRLKSELPGKPLCIYLIKLRFLWMDVSGITVLSMAFLPKKEIILEK